MRLMVQGSSWLWSDRDNNLGNVENGKAEDKADNADESVRQNYHQEANNGVSEAFLGVLQGLLFAPAS